MSGANWIDAHCHLSDPRFDGVLSDVVERAKTAGIRAFVLGGYSPEDWKRQRELKKNYTVILCFGLHPWWIAKQSEVAVRGALKELERELPDASALGELGLDFQPKFGDDTHALQEEAFRAQLDMANRTGKPIVLHIVRAHSQALAILKKFGPSRGIVHSFSGDEKNARDYLDLGLTLSISGGVTRKGYENLKKAVKAIPGDAFVVETDSPDQAPEGWFGSLNEPAALLRIAQAIGAIRGERAEEILERSSTRIKEIFGVSEG